jgi:cellulose synthase/poly-beta-1,6-N-acetylglucosamine synthase-like glycosyltransferase
MFELIIFLTAIMINSTYTLFSAMSLLDIMNRKRNFTDSMLEKTLNSSFYRPITLVVPAYNESQTIVSSLHSQLNIDYAEFEIVVVNDGSKDNTMDVLIKEFELIEIHKPIKIDLKHKTIRKTYISLNYHNLIVIDKENGGKFDAINCGINVSSYPLFCVVDADSLLEKDALLRTGAMFAEDHTLVAVGGTIRPSNGCEIKNGLVTKVSSPKSFIELVQSVEYMRGFLIGRSAWNMFESVLIISGAFGVFRKDIVKKIGGYRHTVGEDMDLIIRMHKHCIDTKLPYRILSIPDTICWTQVPNDWTSLAKQRTRWQRGLIDRLLYNKGMILNPKYKSVGLIGLTYFLIVEALGGVIEFLGYLLLLFLILFSSMNIVHTLYLTLLMFLWTNYITLNAIFFDNLLQRRYESFLDLFKLMFTGIFENFGYRQYLAYHRFIGSITFMKMEWGVIKRSSH